MRRFSLLMPALAALLSMGALYACSSSDSDSGPTPTPDGAAPETGGQDTSVVTPDAAADTSSPVDAADAAVDSNFDAAVALPCTQAQLDANDMTDAGGVTIAFPTFLMPTQYTNNCVKVKVGDVVKFTGAFSAHPL